MLTRRALLLTALAATACRPGGPKAHAVSGTFSSEAMKRRIGWRVLTPTTTRSLPLLLWLHGRNGDHTTVDDLAHPLQRYVDKGGRPFAVVGVDGGAHSYYHRRADGIDPQRMILEELLPRMAQRGLRTDRFAIGGVSMGGYGALLLAETLGPSRITACAVDAPAIFPDARSYSAGSFDSSADFEAHDVITNASRLRTIPVRVVCGLSDPFLPGAKRLLAKVPAEHYFGRGGHNGDFWNPANPAQLAFVGRYLS